jgi:hypothetical protein
MATSSPLVDEPYGGPTPIQAPVAARRHRRWWTAIASAVEWIFGSISLIVGLSVLATIPVAQLLSLGYLHEVSGRVARAGRLRSGFVGVRRAARLGRIVVGVSVLLIPPVDHVIARFFRAAD